MAKSALRTRLVGSLSSELGLISVLRANNPSREGQRELNESHTIMLATFQGAYLSCVN
jgi:hypothetical protein